MPSNYRLIVRLSLFIVFAANPSLLQAAEVPQEALSLDQCLSLAYQNSPDLRASRAEMHVKEGEVVAARGQFLPSLNFASSYQRQSNPPVPFVLGNVRPSFALTEVWAHDLTARQTLFAWGSLIQQHRSAESARLASFETLRSTKQRLKAQVKKAFYDLLLAQEKVRISTEATNVAEGHFKTTTARFHEAQSSSFEAAQSKVYWTNRKTDLMRSENDLHVANAALKKLIGAKDPSPIQIKGDLTYQAVPLEPEVLDPIMLENRPELRSFSFQERQKESLLLIARASHRPNLTASYTRTWQSPTLNNSFANYNDWNALGQLTIPIFDGFSSWGRVASAQAALEETRANRQGELENSRLELQETILRASDAKERIQSQKENVDTARDNLRIAEKRNTLGTLSLLELKDAQLSLTEAEANYLQALYDYAIALVDVDRIVGKD